MRHLFSMNLLKLYKLKHFYEVVILHPLCVEDLDYVILCLSMVAIGRQGAGIVMLRAKAELVSDPQVKICILCSLFELTGLQNFALELEYWKLVSGLDDTLFKKVKPLPRPLDQTASKCMQNFLGNGAFFHPCSYSYTCLKDENVALNLAQTNLSLPWILQTAADGGSATFASKALRREDVAAAFRDIEKLVRVTEIDEDPLWNHSQHLNLSKNLSALACYNHLLGNSQKAFFYSTHAIHVINITRLRCGFSDFHGILDFEKETILMIASQHLPLDSNESFVDRLLHELMNPQMTEESIEIESLDLEEFYGYHPITKATYLRQSMFFSSCGNIYRVTAQHHCKSLSFVYEEQSHKGVILRRDDAIEMARKYILSAALQPPDNPFLYLFYDRIIWSLLLSGGIDLRVVWFFITIRNYYAHQLFFSYVEDNPQFVSQLWLKFDNIPEIIENIFDMCADNLRRATEGPDYLLPTTVDCNDHIVMLKFYIPDPLNLLFDELGQTDIATAESHSQVSEIEFLHLLASSEEVVEMWSSTYQKAHGVVPNDIRQAMKFLEA